MEHIPVIYGRHDCYASEFIIHMLTVKRKALQHVMNEKSILHCEMCP